MSNFPSFLQTVKPTNSFVTYGDELTATEINLLRTQVHSLHYHPIIVVLPKHYHVKDGTATVTEIAKTWGLGPHGMLIVYSPADKDVWAECGTFNASAGVDAGFFKRDFVQRMSTDAREGSLFSALNSSLQDVDHIIVRSQAYAARAVNNQLSPRAGHVHGTHSHTSVVGQVVPAIVLAILVLGVIAKVTGQTSTRRMRLDEQGHEVNGSSSVATPGLSSDVDRIVRVMERGSGGAVARPKTTQVPMAEFQKRASIPVSRATGSSPSVDRGRFGEDVGTASGGSRGSASSDGGVYNSSGAAGGAGRGEVDHAADFQTAIDNSAANTRQEARRIRQETTSQQSQNEDVLVSEAPAPTANTYTASFEANSQSGSSAVPVTTNTSRLLNLSPYSQEPAGDQNFPTLPQQYSSDSKGDGDVIFAGPVVPAKSGAQAIPTKPNPTLPMSASVVAGAATGAATGTSPASATPVPAVAPSVAASVPEPTPFHSVSFPASPALAAAAAAASSSPTLSASDAFNSSFGTQPIDLTFNLGMPGGVVSSLTSSGSTPQVASQADIACPKCTEPKSKDFSFCLKCGHNF